MRRILPLLCCVIAYMHTFAQKDCRHTEYSDATTAAHPELIKKLASVEEFTYNHTGDRRTILSTETSTAPLPDIITIPVVIHILYNSDAQNLSEKQVQSQIDALNKDYRNLNTDRTNVPAYFNGFMADCGIEFKLAKADPNGLPTNGIVRRKTSIQFFGTDDRAKFTAQGGDDAWDASKYLNIWVCNLSGGVVGYASLVGCAAENDGVVVATTAFGIASGNSPAFNKGRTATHEIGHWLNLRHIWGDTYCGDDKVDDTPSQRSPNRGCPSGKNMTCGTTANGDMYMNFMDLTDDACMYMFTKGQRDRMRAGFMSGGIRNSLLTSSAFSPISEGILPTDDNVSNKPGLHIYPNPATTSITVEVSESILISKGSFVIYNHTGQAVQTCMVTGKTNTIDISRLTNGMYYLKQTDGGAATVAKFFKVK